MSFDQGFKFLLNIGAYSIHSEAHREGAIGLYSIKISNEQAFNASAHGGLKILSVDEMIDDLLNTIPWDYHTKDYYEYVEKNVKAVHKFRKCFKGCVFVECKKEKAQKLAGETGEITPITICNDN